ncbi:MAG: 6-phosphofructokinase [Pseudomonadota bacterium]
MNESQDAAFDALLDHPVARAATDDVNQELIERNQYVPPASDVFCRAYTGLDEMDGYRFDIDREARKKLPDIIGNKVQRIVAMNAPDAAFVSRYSKARRIGIVFSGGPAPGGHNVIAGIFDAAKRVNPDTVVFGFMLGPDGIIENEAVEITAERVNAFRNLGGFTMIKTGRTKIDTPEKMALSRATCTALNLDAVVVVGGDDSNTNAAFLAQELFREGVQVIGVPKTIDGDIQVRDASGEVLCAMSFGFHTAARAFSQNIGNLCTDASSDVKYWHICKVMGRVASHLALEVALQTHANMTLIGEDLAEYVDQQRLAAASKSGATDYTAYGMTLRHLSRVICDGIVRRAAAGKNFGVIVIPEGVLEFINEIQIFIIKLNTLIGEYNRTHDIDFHSAFPRLPDKLEYLRRQAILSRENGGLSIWSTRDDELFNDVPEFFQEGLLSERDSHGNFQFSLVETDKVLLGLVRDYLNILKEKGKYKIGIEKRFFEKVLATESLDSTKFGPVLFRNWGRDDYLLFHETIISKKTLGQALSKAGLIANDKGLPAAVLKIYKASDPKFKTQTHFYGYDGRGSDPTRFDCNYTYNLGLTVFSLIANGATGQMAVIRNLEQDFSQWQPLGVPIASLMHLEERQGRLSLVLEKSIVDTHSVSFRVVKANREKWLAATPGDDHFRRPGPIRFTGQSEEDRPLTLQLNSLAAIHAADDRG